MPDLMTHEGYPTRRECDLTHRALNDKIESFDTWLGKVDARLWGMLVMGVMQLVAIGGGLIVAWAKFGN